MGNAALSQAKKRYDPIRDRARMKTYMAEVRTKNKAGYKHLTVGQWKKLHSQPVSAE